MIHWKIFNVKGISYKPWYGSHFTVCTCVYALENTQNGHIFAISSKYQWAVGLWVIAVFIFGAFLYVPHFLQPPHVGNGTWMFLKLWRWLVIIREALLRMLESKFIEELLLKVAPVPVCCCPEWLPTWDTAPTCPFSFITLPCFVRTSHMLFLLCHSSSLVGLCNQMLTSAISCTLWSGFHSYGDE